MIKFFIKLVILVVSLFSVNAYCQMMGMMHDGDMMTIRHRFVMQNGVDPVYAARVNLLKNTAKNVADGKRLYEQNCALCHGKTGSGDGEAGKNLNPPPANIKVLSKRPIATDGYLYWSIAEGGVPMGTGMPPFKGNLKEDEIWKIIIYLREF
jgi:mono/diheme cytochrome c family protein